MGMGSSNCEIIKTNLISIHHFNFAADQIFELNTGKIRHEKSRNSEKYRYWTWGDVEICVFPYLLKKI